MSPLAEHGKYTWYFQILAVLHATNEYEDFTQCDIYLNAAIAIPC
jgi:hypothetical protein